LIAGGRLLKIDSRVRAARKPADDVGMAIHAGFVAGVMRAGDFRRCEDGALKGGARIQEQHRARDAGSHGQGRYSLLFHFRFQSRFVMAVSASHRICRLIRRRLR
jgi:hypothetical protein